MKKALTSFFSILLAAIVLVSGTSFTVKKMVCLSSGNVETAFYSMNECCGEEEGSANGDVKIDSKCCDYSTESFYVEHNAPVKTITFNISAELLSASLPTGIFMLPVAGCHKEVHSFADLPPPLQSHERLALHSIYII